MIAPPISDSRPGTSSTASHTHRGAKTSTKRPISATSATGT